MRGKRRQRQIAPHEVVIEGMSHEGRGIARINGKTVFVAGALPGERVQIRIHRRARQFDQASTLAVLEPSPQRIEPGCDAYSVCGGCSLQHLAADDQIEFKQQMLLEQFAHAGITVGEILPPLRSGSWGYRRKARLGVKHVPAKQRVLVGFRERATPYIADMRACEVLLPEVGHRLERISAMLGELEARARIPQIEVAADADQVQLVFRHLDPLSADDLEKLTAFARETGFLVQLQPGGPDTVHNLYPAEQSLFFEPEAESEVGGPIRIGFCAHDFVQVNFELNQAMVAQAMQLLDPGPGDSVLDLFCGLGNFTLPLARRAARVFGVEGDAAMVTRARQAAEANGFDNTDYAVADLDDSELQAAWLRQRYDLLLLDPPRSGALEIARRCGELGPRRVLYVSCQPSSLVRDAAMICAQGYRLSRLGVMDMFPQTAHVESMAVFEK